MEEDEINVAEPDAGSGPDAGDMPDAGSGPDAGDMQDAGVRAGSERRRGWIRGLGSYVVMVFAGVLAGLFLTHFIVFNAEVPSESMENLISVDDRLFGLRTAYLFSGPERFDIVIFKYPVDESVYYIKRIIGLPGETVEIRDAHIYIDGSDTPLEEDYLPEEWVVGSDGYVFEVPDGCYLMLGDNRNISEDARYWAERALEKGVASTEEEALGYSFVHRDKIAAKAVLKYKPELAWLNHQ